MCKKYSGCSRALHPFALVCGLIISAGCGGIPAPQTADADEAQGVLERVLESWKKGERAESLKTAAPSIVAWDPRWERGDRLSKFELQGPGTPSGAERKFRVALWLTNAKSKEAREVVNFKVGTAPVITVLRALFD
jgi:hypothetical protein